jgi:hypothetical protein
MNGRDFPPRRRGRFLHFTLILLLAVIAGVLIFLLTRQPVNLAFTAMALVTAVAVVLIPVLAYRLYCLYNANYNISREHLAIKWGLRLEQIPVSEIEWVRPLTAFPGPLPKPVFRLPGSILGQRQHKDLGPIEFIASDENSLLLAATSRKVFAISPEDPAGFLQEIQRAIEMGSLTSPAPRSVYPSFIVAQAWDSLAARFLWLAGFFINLGLFAWVTLMMPDRVRISLGFLPSGAARPASPGYSLILLPIVSLVLFLAGWVTGMIVYRREDRRSLAYIIWSGGLVASVLFLLAVLFIVITPA